MPDTFRYWVYKWVKHMDPALMELLVGEGWGDTSNCNEHFKGKVHGL